MSATTIPEFKVILVGDAGVGKDKFLQRQLHEPFDDTYDCTMGFHVVPLTFYTNNHGPIKFNVWHTSGIKVRFRAFWVFVIYDVSPYEQ